MYEELHRKAKKKVEAKLAFFICGVTFVCTSVILVMLSIYLPAIAIWLLIPIPAMAMVLGILYISIFGLTASGDLSSSWREKEIEKEMVKLYHEKKATEELSDVDHLELKELERLTEKWERGEDYRH